jgi:hypothetical protein
MAISKNQEKVNSGYHRIFIVSKHLNKCRGYYFVTCIYRGGINNA